MQSKHGNAAECSCPPGQSAESADGARVVLIFPGLKIPSLNELINWHYIKRSKLHKDYSRRLAACKLPLQEAIEEHRSTLIISLEDASRSGMKSRGSSDGTTPSTGGSTGSTGKKKATSAWWKSRRRGK